MSPVEIADRIREAVRADPRTLAVLAKAIGVDPVTLRLFQSRRRDLSFDALSRLAPIVGLEIVVRERNGLDKL